MDPHVEELDAAAAGAAAAATGVVAAAENPIHQVLRTFGVTTLAARMTFINVKGLDELSAFAQLSGDADVTEMAKRMASRPSTVGRVILGTMHIKRIQALVFWVKDHDKHCLIAEAELWNTDAMEEAMERKEAEHNYSKVDIAGIDPGKCRVDHGWDNWQIAFENKLNATLGAAKVPINYVIRIPIEERHLREKKGVIAICIRIYLRYPSKIDLFPYVLLQNMYFAGSF